MAPLPDEQQPDRGDASAGGEAQEPLPPAAPGQGTRPAEGTAAEGVSSPTMPPAGSPMERPESETPPQQESQPPPSFQRWMYGVGAAVIVFAIIWALLSASQV